MATAPKNLVLTEAGRSPWYKADGTALPAYIIGIAGGSASGKTRVAQHILNKLNVPWVLVVAMDSFYLPLSPAQSKRAFNNEHDFDSPDAFDTELLRTVLLDLKASKSVQIPNYSFVLHQRTEETTQLYGATIVIIEGIFVLNDPRIRDLLDLKIFVQCDSDLMLARRLRRDIVERGRDATGVLDQYLRFVKPSFDNFIQPTARYADVIVPGQSNEISIELITSHIRIQLDERKRNLELRQELFRNGGGEGDMRLTGELPDNTFVMEQTAQLTGIHTILRDISTPMPDFIFFANRLSTLVIEHALSLLPYQDSPITTRTQIPYTGQELAIPAGNLCGVSILRSGAPLEQGLRRAVRDVPIGSILIQSDTTTGEPLLFHLSLPSCLTKSTLSAQNSYVLLMDSQIGTGAAALMACRTLLDHGVKEENILFCALLVSRWGGIWAIRNAFPRVRIACSAVDDEMEARVEDGKKVFAILPGMGSFGDRYYGA